MPAYRILEDDVAPVAGGAGVLPMKRELGEVSAPSARKALERFVADHNLEGYRPHGRKWMVGEGRSTLSAELIRYPDAERLRFVKEQLGENARARLPVSLSRRARSRFE